MTIPNPTEFEARLLAAIEDRETNEESVLAQTEQLPSGMSLVLFENWKERARDLSLEDWRRLASYRILVEKVIAYPCEKERFVQEAVVSMGVPEGQIADMTRAGALPFERHQGERILMANLPIRTSVGPASVYFALSLDGSQVRTAKVYPESAGRSQVSTS